MGRCLHGETRWGCRSQQEPGTDPDFVGGLESALPGALPPLWDGPSTEGTSPKRQGTTAVTSDECPADGPALAGAFTGV